MYCLNKKIHKLFIELIIAKVSDCCDIFISRQRKGMNPALKKVAR